MTYSETLHFLYHSLPVFQHIGGNAYKPGFGNITELEKELGEPHRRFRSVHVAGTNGKGSVSHMTAAVLQAAGYRTGLFTSPHLKDFRERIRVNGEMISEEAVVAFVSSHRKAIDRIRPSFFEITTAIAFDHFARKRVDIAVIEVGMGGRLDSTNVIRPLVSVITNISWDHAQFLGDTLEKIAGEKAGIIKEMTPVVIGESQIESQLTFIARAKECSAPILFADQTYHIVNQADNGEMMPITGSPKTLATGKTLPQDSCGQVAATPRALQPFTIENLLDGETFTLCTDLLGDYQRKNILTALTVLDVLNGSGGLQIPREAVQKGMASAAASTGLLGRWQIVGHAPLTVCDTGHNEGGLREIAAQIARQQFHKLYMVLGFVADKDLSKVLPLLPKEAHYIFTRAGIERALDENILARRAAEYGLQGETAPTVTAAVARARELARAEDMIYIGGSTFVVAEFL